MISKVSFFKNQNIYITSDEDIMIGDFYIAGVGIIYQCLSSIELEDLSINSYCKKIILTTDVDLIKDEVQAIDEEFLQWFVKNPSCERVEVEVDLSKHNGQFQTKYGWKIIIPQEKAKQETIEEAAEKYALLEDAGEGNDNNIRMYSYDFIAGAKSDAARDYWFKEFKQEQDKNKYSEEEVKHLIHQACYHSGVSVFHKFEKWFEQFKKK
jgi:hypothetical protein